MLARHPPNNKLSQWKVVIVKHISSTLAMALCLLATHSFGQERSPANRPPSPAREGGQRYSIEQAVSDRAQLHTIAFDGLAFLTGDFGYDTFLPPGKVSDYFGFQYMRDIDAKVGGHNTSFLTIIASNMLRVLNTRSLAHSG
jgi:hypothetical protein